MDMKYLVRWQLKQVKGDVLDFYAALVEKLTKADRKRIDNHKPLLNRYYKQARTEFEFGKPYDTPRKTCVNGLWP